MAEPEVDPKEERLPNRAAPGLLMEELLGEQMPGYQEGRRCREVLLAELLEG